MIDIQRVKYQSSHWNQSEILFFVIFSQMSHHREIWKPLTCTYLILQVKYTPLNLYIVVEQSVIYSLWVFLVIILLLKISLIVTNHQDQKNMLYFHVIPKTWLVSQHFLTKVINHQIQIVRSPSMLSKMVQGVCSRCRLGCDWFIIWAIRPFISPRGRGDGLKVVDPPSRSKQAVLFPLSAYQQLVLYIISTLIL